MSADVQQTGGKANLLLVLCILVLVSVYVYCSNNGGSVPLFLVAPPLTKRRHIGFTFPWHARIHIDNSTNPVLNNLGCSVQFQYGSWTQYPVSIDGHTNCTSQTKYAYCSLTAERRWFWASDISINVFDDGTKALSTVIKGDGALSRDVQRHMDSGALRQQLDHTWIAFVGDSIARKLLIAMMITMQVDRHKMLFDRHSDFEYNDESRSQRITFHWAPFPGNASSVIQAWNEKKPDAVIVSVSLWHILHVHDEVLFFNEIQQLGATAGKKAAGTTWMFATTPEVFHDHLGTLKKKQEMTSARVDAYNKAMYDSMIFEPKGPFKPIDIFNLTFECGAECSLDGVHSYDYVYNVAVQWFMHILRYCIGRS